MKKIYAIWDILAEDIAGPLQLLPHDAVAVRLFSDVASDPQTMLNRHVVDHDLRCIGEFDGGVLTAYAQPRVVITGRAWKSALDAKSASAESDPDQLKLIREA